MKCSSFISPSHVSQVQTCCTLSHRVKIGFDNNYASICFQTYPLAPIEDSVLLIMGKFQKAVSDICR